jgi:hypothetical protein
LPSAAKQVMANKFMATSASQDCSVRCMKDLARVCWGERTSDVQSMPDAPLYCNHFEHGVKNHSFSDVEPHHPMTHVNPQPYGSETAISENKRLESRGK